MKRPLFFIAILLLPYAGQCLSKYFIAVKKNEGNVLSDLANYTPMLPPVHKFYADPMLFKHEGINYLFFEEYDYKKGVISYVTVDKNLNISSPKKVLELTQHASFPYIFEDNGRIYMVPETAALGEVALYEALNFPNNWVKRRTLLKRGWFGDSILFKYDGYYWIFTVLNSVADLHIYYAKNLFSTFQPHPINQEKYQGRNAGKIFRSYGKLIRPTMDCGPEYGYGVIFNEIVELTPTTFIEKPVAKIEPNWALGLSGSHTFNINEDLVVYDGRRYIKEEEEHLYSSSK